MEKQIYELNYAGHPVRYSFLDPQTRFLLHPLPRRADGVCADVAATPELLEEVRAFFPEDTSDRYLEYRCMIGLTARTLLRYGCCIFHAVSFVWRERAWLLTAPPETGKTTQYLNWQRLHPGEITMISGDMPVLEGREDGSVWVHPSSWNGKEDYSSDQSAPLGGLVLLEQGSEDRIRPLLPKEAIMPLFKQFMVVPETEDEVLALTDLIGRMLTAVPCWKMVNRGGDASTELLRRTLAESIGEEA